jgi:hypothetical protein
MTGIPDTANCCMVWHLLILSPHPAILRYKCQETSQACKILALAFVFSPHRARAARPLVQIDRDCEQRNLYQEPMDLYQRAQCCVKLNDVCQDFALSTNTLIGVLWGQGKIYTIAFRGDREYNGTWAVVHKMSTSLFESDDSHAAANSS